MDAPSFAGHHLRFAGQTGWVVGRGPTRYRYEDLAAADGPVFFINDAVAEERQLPHGHPSFFFAHDRSMAAWLRSPGLRSQPVLITDQPKTGADGERRPGLLAGPDDPLLREVPQALLYRGTGPLDPATILDRSREEIRDHGQLYLANGTIQPLLHFAWYVGCSRLKLIGCDGLPGVGYDARLENRSRSQQQNALFIRRRQEVLLRRLNLPAEYLGTPPHRIRMIYEARTDAGGAGALRDWAAALVAQVRAAGCREVVVKDRLAAGQPLWVNGTWPELAGCVACLASPAHLALHAEGEALVARHGGRLRSAYQAEPAPEE
jgi:hypothetical protein